jgi:hypothetical protein
VGAFAEHLTKVSNSDRPLITQGLSRALTIHGVDGTDSGDTCIALVVDDPDRAWFCRPERLCDFGLLSCSELAIDGHE